MTFLLHSPLWWPFACDRCHFFLEDLMIENYHCFSEVLCGGPWPPRSHSHWHHHRHDSGKAYLHFYWHLISWSFISISAFCIRSLKSDLSNVCVGYFLGLHFDKFMCLFFDSYWPHIIQGLNNLKWNRSWKHSITKTFSTFRGWTSWKIRSWTRWQTTTSLDKQLLSSHGIRLRVM